MKKISTLFIVLFLLIGINLSHAQDISECIDLFIWAGQSNALGWMGNAAFYPADPENLDADIRFNYTYIDNTSSGGQWISMQKQEGIFPAGHFGAEVSFSRELKKAGYKPAIFKYSKGGTSIYNNWKRPGQSGMYDDMVDDLKDAISILENEGHKVNIRAFIWIQGESDAKTSTYANAYYNNLLSIINDFRNNVAKNEHLTIVLGVDEQYPTFANQPKVLEAHRKLDTDDENIVFTSMLRLQKADETHLTPTALVTHGERIFAGFDSTYSRKLSLPQMNIEPGDSVLIFGQYRKEAGVYRDTLIAANGCDSISIQKLSVGNETLTFHAGYGEFLTTFPNPFTDRLNIEFASIQKNINIEMYSISGQFILNRKTSNSKGIQINTSGIKPSLYFVHIQSGAGSFVHKCLKR